MKTPPFNTDLAEQILELVAAGEGLNAACKKLTVGHATARQWAAENLEFGRLLALARREGLEVWADEIISIGDEVAGSTENAEVQAARVRIDSRKWLLSKLNPERYGDKVELTGKDGRDLLAPEAQIPKLMSILAILLPGTSNSELHGLAETMSEKLRLTHQSSENGRDD